MLVVCAGKIETLKRSIEEVGSRRRSSRQQQQHQPQPKPGGAGDPAEPSARWVAACGHSRRGISGLTGGRSAFLLCGIWSLSGNCQRMVLKSPHPYRLSSVTESVALPPEARWNAMTDYPAAIPLFAIQQLRCPKCRARMKLARVSSGPTGFELRTFDCSNCDQVEQIAIPLDDPMKSDAVGWFTGELRPPK